MFARIFRPAKTAMQSGKSGTAFWIMKFRPESARRTDPLTGWTGAQETVPGQVVLKFDSCQEAVAYAERQGIAYRIEPEHSHGAKRKPKAYADNFSFRRRLSWTH